MKQKSGISSSNDSDEKRPKIQDLAEHPKKNSPSRYGNKHFRKKLNYCIINLSRIGQNAREEKKKALEDETE